MNGNAPLAPGVMGSGLDVFAFPQLGVWPGFGLYVPAFPAASAYQPIDPNLLAATGADFFQTINSSLASIANEGFGAFSTESADFNSWAGIQANFEQSVAQSFSSAVGKSAKACAGFFSCLFG